GYGNKVSGSDESYDNSDTRFGSHQDTSSYSGQNEYGSGTVGGAGAGNKTGSHESGKKDSTMGKLMEKAGLVHYS
ncbi:hypothetical protein LTR53_019200, partial [Teratosphaeriaceae sp. CCFEE 6253]